MTTSMQKKSIDDYINTFPETTKKALQSLQIIIRELIPNYTEEISYGIPTFKVNGKYVVYFAAYKRHISLYPVSKKIIKSLDEKQSYKLSGKGTLQFPIDKPLPWPLIKTVVKKLFEEFLERQK